MTVLRCPGAVCLSPHHGLRAAAPRVAARGRAARRRVRGAVRRLGPGAGAGRRARAAPPRTQLQIPRPIAFHR